MLSYKYIVKVLLKNGFIVSPNSNGYINKSVSESVAQNVDYIVDTSGDCTYYRVFRHLYTLKAGGVLLLQFGESQNSVNKFLSVLTSLTGCVADRHVDTLIDERYLLITKVENIPNGK